jgi:predicted amidohydrolase YtcJ
MMTEINDPINFSMLKIFLVLVISSYSFSCNGQNQKADLIITNASIWTGNENQPRANAIAITNDIILAVGSKEDLLKYIGNETRTINLNGEFITPGFIDSHVHLITGGFNLSSVQLRDAKTPEEFIKRIKEFVKTVEPGTWILGGDWDHELWGGELPTKQWIDKFTKDHPVFITRLDGHMSLANSLAMQLAGIDERVKSVEGGTIVRNSDKKPTGIFKDNAMALISEKIPEPSEKESDEALIDAMNFVASKGVTSVHHMAGYFDAFKRAYDNNKLITRVYFSFPLAKWKMLEEKIEKEGIGDKWLKIGGLKGFIDGSLGSHTAAFYKPYTDIPTDKGFYVNSEKDLYSWISQADSAGLQVMIHAIGDRAINFLLNTYENVGKENGVSNRRFRIEHAQHIASGDIKRFGLLNVIPSMQPYHAIDDGKWAEKLIGSERIKTTYAFRSLLDSNAKVAFGSDWFVAPPTPLEGIYAAVTRRTLDDKNPDGWVPEQKITVEEALIAYTINAAYASFDEKIKGSLEPGKLADFVVIDKDLTKIKPNEIIDSKVLQTWVGGIKIFDINEKK